MRYQYTSRFYATRNSRTSTKAETVPKQLRVHNLVVRYRSPKFQKFWSLKSEISKKRYKMNPVLKITITVLPVRVMISQNYIFQKLSIFDKIHKIDLFSTLKAGIFLENYQFWMNSPNYLTYPCSESIFSLCTGIFVFKAVHKMPWDGAEWFSELLTSFKW